MISIFGQIHREGTPVGCGINWSVVHSDLHHRGCPICHPFGVDAEAAIMHHNYLPLDGSRCTETFQSLPEQKKRIL